MKSLILFLLFGVSSLAFGQDQFPDEWMPWKDPDNADVIVLEEESRDSWRKRRDTSKDPEREAGPINPQRYSCWSTG